MLLSTPLLLIFEILINIYEGFLYILFCNAVFHSKRKHRLWSVVFILLIGAAYTLYSLFDLPLSDACIFILPIIYSLIFFDNPPIECIFWNVIQGTVVFGVINLCYAIYIVILGHNFAFLSNENLARIPYVISTNALITAALFLLIQQKKRCLFEKYTLILLSCINLISISIVDILYYFYDEYTISEQWVLIISVLAFCVSILSIAMYRIISSYVQKKREHEQLILLQQNNEKELENIQKSWEAMNGLKHDLNNHINILYTMFENGEMEPGKQYIDSLRKKVVKSINTGCRSLDYLLMLKTEELKKTNAVFHCHLGDLSEIPVDESTLCAIVSNLLDNAIEALLRQANSPDELNLTLKINRVRNMLSIDCTNTIQPNMVKQDGQLLISSKRPGNVPGIGLNNVKRMVREVSGELDIEITDTFFNINLMIPYPFKR